MTVKEIIACIILLIGAGTIGLIAAMIEKEFRRLTISADSTIPPQKTIYVDGEKVTGTIDERSF